MDAQLGKAKGAGTSRSYHEDRPETSAARGASGGNTKHRQRNLAMWVSCF
uniref:Uncharacterized protein n=1 Tax=Tetraselmis sp. GSL018 TaxID=582737 RepID=A0A061QNS9_9CHLO